MPTETMRTDADQGLLRRRALWPLLTAQGLGALNDHLLKTALALFVVFRLAGEDQSAQLVNLATGLFVLPFLLFSAFGGRVADKFEKSRLIRWLKLAELGVMVVASVGFLLSSTPILLTALFLMGAQSAFFSPVRYAILPEHLPADRLNTANAFFETTVYLAILGGTIAGGLLVRGADGPLLVSATLLGLAVLGYAASRLVPRAAPGQADMPLAVNPLTDLIATLGRALRERGTAFPLFGIAWFYMIGAAYMTQMPVFARQSLNAGEEVVTLFLVTFSLGVGMGAVVAARLLAGAISARLVPLGLVGLAVFAIDLAINAPPPGAMPEPMGAAGFLATFAGWHLLVDLMMIACFGGLFVVPLVALVQERGSQQERARLFAASNMLNAILVVVISLASGAILSAGVSVADLYGMVAVLSVIAAGAVCAAMPKYSIGALSVGFRRVLNRD